LLDDREEGFAHWRVRGRVQGVGFRWFVLREARREGLRGDVRNLADGSVEIRAVGPAERLARLLSAVRRGPQGARVDTVDELERQAGAKPDGIGGPEDGTFRGFEIRR